MGCFLLFVVRQLLVWFSFCWFFYQRYYYYIHNGIGTEEVAAMEDSWLEHVLDLVPEHLKGLSGTIEALSDEMREDYLLSVKKAIGTVFSFAYMSVFKVNAASGL